VAEAAGFRALRHLGKVSQRVVGVLGEEAGGGSVWGAVGGRGAVRGWIRKSDLTHSAQLAEAIDLGNAGQARGAVAFILGFGGGADVGGEKRRAVAVGGDGGPAEGIELEAVAGLGAVGGGAAGRRIIRVADEALAAESVEAGVRTRPLSGGGLRGADDRAAEAIEGVDVVHPGAGCGVLQALGLSGGRGVGVGGDATVGEAGLGEAVEMAGVGVGERRPVVVGVGGGGNGAGTGIVGGALGLAEGVGDRGQETRGL